MTITDDDVVAAYTKTRDEIAAKKKQLEEELRPLQELQEKRESWLLAQRDPQLSEFLTSLYIYNRDLKSQLNKVVETEIPAKQAAIEKWLLTTLDALKSKGMKTAFGTVYPTRKESVSVADWDAFLDAEILRPMTDALYALLQPDYPQEDFNQVVLESLKTSAHFEFLNKAANKTTVLERMGDLDEKTKNRPNPPPAGINYSAVRTVGVRKS